MSNNREETILDLQVDVNLEARVTEIARRAPHVLMRPNLSRDGNQFCFLYGPNPMEGIAGYGDTPRLAAKDFDLAWNVWKEPKENSNKQNLAPDLKPNEKLEKALKDNMTKAPSTFQVNSSDSIIRWAEGLIEQLPSIHNGRNSWLLNYGQKSEALRIQKRHANRVK